VQKFAGRAGGGKGWGPHERTAGEGDEKKKTWGGILVSRGVQPLRSIPKSKESVESGGRTVRNRGKKRAAIPRGRGSTGLKGGPNFSGKGNQRCSKAESNVRARRTKEFGDRGSNTPSKIPRSHAQEHKPGKGGGGGGGGGGGWGGWWGGWWLSPSDKERYLHLVRKAGKEKPVVKEGGAGRP